MQGGMWQQVLINVAVRNPKLSWVAACPDLARGSYCRRLPTGTAKRRGHRSSSLLRETDLLKYVLVWRHAIAQHTLCLRRVYSRTIHMSLPLLEWDGRLNPSRCIAGKVRCVLQSATIGVHAMLS